jgi:LacI family transcriptional regulator
MPTITDVARLAGVSVTTVSHVINGTRFVSDELRARVVAAMEELRYRPNYMARSLRSGETKIIGLVVPDNSNPFFAEVARIIEDVGFENGYSVILCNSDGDLKKEEAYINLLISKQVDGVIFIASGDKQDLVEELISNGIQVIIADRNIPQSVADVVLVNNEQGGYEATRYLVALGHKRIGCISGPSELSPSADRVKGYKRALKEAGVPVRDELIVAGDLRYQGGEIAMQNLLNLPNRPTAVFASNDMMALGAMRAVRQAGLQIPNDISLVGFDDITLAAALSPALTTVSQPVNELAQLTVQRLIDRIQNSEQNYKPEQYILETKLIVRDSCSPPQVP